VATNGIASRSSTSVICDYQRNKSRYKVVVLFSREHEYGGESD